MLVYNEIMKHKKEQKVNKVKFESFIKSPKSKLNFSFEKIVKLLFIMFPFGIKKCVKEKISRDVRLTMLVPQFSIFLFTYDFSNFEIKRYNPKNKGKKIAIKFK